MSETQAAPADEKYDKEYLRYLRKTGQERPEGVSMKEWLAPFSLSNRHEAIATLAAPGHLSNIDIAKLTGYTPVHIGNLLQSDLMKDLIEKKRTEILGKPIQQRLNDVLNPAMGLIEKALLDPEHADALTGMKNTDRISLAKWAIEKVTGKAPQEINSTQNYLVNILQVIEERDRKERTVSDSTQAHETKAVTAPPSNPIDAWVNSHIPESDFNKDDMQDGSLTVHVAPEPQEPDLPSPHDEPVEPTPFSSGALGES